MVLHNRENDLIVWLQLQPGGDDVDCMRAALGEDDAVGRGRINEARHALTRRLERGGGFVRQRRSEEHTSELQSLMRISYAVFCLKKKKKKKKSNKEAEL